MPSPKTKEGDIASSLSHLNLDSSKKIEKPIKKAKKPVADSWEDEDLSDSDEDPQSSTPTTSSTVPSAPPPTPSSSVFTAGDEWASISSSGPSSPPSSEPSKRPEKTDAVARRMIAAGLGLKAPKQTDEQKAYQASIREQEKKKREEERAAERKRREDAEKAKAAVWDD